METIFPREEKTSLLFQKILDDPEACKRLSETFYGEIDPDQEDIGGYLEPRQFAEALFRAYTNRDLTAFLIAITGNSMFDLLRNSFLTPFKFNEDGIENPIILTDAEGILLPDSKIDVPARDYERFRREFREMNDCKMYLADGWRLSHVYDPETMNVVTRRYDEHFGVLLLYELPDTVKKQESESQAYAAILDLLLALEKEVPGTTVYYEQEAVQEGARRYDGMGIFLSKHHLLTNFDRKLETISAIVRGEKNGTV